MDKGVNELYEGVTIITGRQKYILPPSSFAEAHIGMMKPGEIKHQLEGVIEEVINGRSAEAPVIAEIIRKKGGISYEDLEERVRKHHEERASLLNMEPIKDEDVSGGGVWYFVVKRRGDARGERDRKVVISLDQRGNIVDFSCECPTYNKNLAKGNFDSLMNPKEIYGYYLGGNFGNGALVQPQRDVSGFPLFTTRIACYHVASALIQIAQSHGKYSLPFDFTNVAIFEALVMDKFKDRKEADIDDYLIRQGALTEETVRRTSEGEQTLEVAKHSTNFDKYSHRIIQGLRRMLEQREYSFSGFATDFRGTPYKTTSVVFTKRDGRSVHILCDSKFGAYDTLVDSELPFILSNVPVFVWTEEGKQQVMTEIGGNPIANTGTHFLRFDERTQTEVVSVITRPPRELLTGLEAAYGRVYETIMKEITPKPVIRQ
ncbi:hypothetical protein HYV83_02200 [Candidatus Woesearchaeota archaeon]|nr:hypothetical protein [Candidatus Woesearchaeota archaeon]